MFYLLENKIHYQAHEIVDMFSLWNYTFHWITWLHTDFTRLYWILSKYDFYDITEKKFEKNAQQRVNNKQ